MEIDVEKPQVPSKKLQQKNVGSTEEYSNEWSWLPTGSKNEMKYGIY